MTLFGGRLPVDHDYYSGGSWLLDVVAETMEGQLGQLVECPLEDGGTVLVLVHNTARAGGPMACGLHGEQVTERVRQASKTPSNALSPAQAIITRLRGLNETPRRSAGRVRPGPTRRSRCLHRRLRRRRLQNRPHLAGNDGHLESGAVGICPRTTRAARPSHNRLLLRQLSSINSRRAQDSQLQRAKL